jgi:hypothetical protein
MTLSLIHLKGQTKNNFYKLRSVLTFMVQTYLSRWFTILKLLVNMIDHLRSSYVFIQSIMYLLELLYIERQLGSCTNLHTRYSPLLPSL